MDLPLKTYFAHSESTPKERYSTKELNDLCTLLKKHDLHKFSSGSLSIEFVSPKEVKEALAASGVSGALVTSDQTPQVPKPWCACGHEIYQHSPDAGCYEGCYIGICVPTPDEESV